MEPHSATAWWEGERLEAIDSNQGPFTIAAVLATLFSLSLDRVHIRTEHVGGGFGSKGLCGPQLILAVMAARRFRRPVRVTLTRAQVFLATAMRPATDQLIRIGADADGRLRAIWHESATDELAERLGMDPLELRLRNEPAVGPVSGLPYSNRNLVACLREGARRFGWGTRDHWPRRRREGPLLAGTGLAATSFSAGAFPSSASITAEQDGTFTVAIGATDLGTGARTALTAIAADALAVGTDRIRLRISDSDLGPVWSAGGSRGTTSWAWAITEAAAKLRGQACRGTVTVDTTPLLGDLPSRERHSYSAVFAEVAVDPATGEVRVRRLLGMFAVGRVINPLMARSQVVGGMIGGLSMALHEEGLRDPVSGRHVNADFAGDPIAAHADVPDIEADFVPDYEPGIPMGVKGAGEIGNVGTAAAIANAVWHATGVRQRSLPIWLDRVLEA
ncbi:xanthine dehydrogenase family protein molybdopterin-binding subunit [Nonomuraea sediminis]|uniref:xanthine dehydrogenase family protein molybdopterin-binding subunit n=1 Tax=Nonomuraea sediminis TaxID=2835864 RepID=UPI001BDD547A|nr:xanthine dehydrogenase family protein molybdopterin-binding subunit [Nonomuraea sediminis]